MKLFGLVLAIAGTIVAFTGSVLGYYQWGGAGLIAIGAGAVIAVISYILQHRSSEPFVLEFSEKDWILGENEDMYHLKLLPSQHRRGNKIKAEVQMKRDGSYVPVYCSEEVMDDGTCIITISRTPLCGPFAGRVILK